MAPGGALGLLTTVSDVKFARDVDREVDDGRAVQAFMTEVQDYIQRPR